MIITRRLLHRAARAVAAVPLLGLALFAQFVSMPAVAADTLNVYSIWPENWARPMFEEFEKATGIKVNFVRFSSGEALARVIAEKNNSRVDVLFGGPVETFAAGINEGLFEPYKPPSFAALPPRFRHADGQWIAIADDPLVFMSNDRFIKDNSLKAPASWNDLLAPAYKNMLQMADARTSGTAVTRIFSILEVYGRDENKAFDYMKKLRPNVQLYTKSGGGGTLPVGLGQAGAGIFFIVDALDTKAKGYEVTISFPQEGIGTTLSAQSPSKGLAPGDTVQIIVRPEAVEVVRDDAGPLRATIVSRSFLGEKIEYWVRCAGETLQVVRYNAGPGEVIPDGATISLRCAEDAMTVLPEPSIESTRRA